MPYDSYKPSSDIHLHERRSARGRNGDDPMFWRREQPTDRSRSRRHPSEEVISPTPQSGITSGSEKGTRFERTTSMGLDFRSRPVAPRPNTAGRRSSSGILPAHRLSLSTSFSPSDLQADTCASPQSSTMDTHAPIKTADPRLRNQIQSVGMPRDQEASPSHSSSAETQGEQSYGELVKEIANVVVGRTEMKKELQYLLTQIRKNEENLASAQKMFSGEHAYIEKVKRDLQDLQAAYKTPKSQIEDLTKREEAALQALSARDNLTEQLIAELQETRKDLKEEKAISKRLQSSNDKIKQQVSQMSAQIQALGNQIEDQETRARNELQEQLTRAEDAAKASSSAIAAVESLVQELNARLDQFQKESKDVRGNDTESLRQEVKQQKLAMARLNDVFATKESFSTIITMVGDLDQKLKSIPSTSSAPPANNVTQSQLNNYVAIFNQFEKDTNERFRKLEDHNKDTNSIISNMATLEDLKKQADALSAERIARQKLGEKLEDMNEGLLDLKNKHNESLGNLDQTIKIIAHRVQHLMAQQQTTLSSMQGYEQMQQNIDVLRNLIKNLDQVSKANTHSIDSLNQRFNNLTSEQLARQMIGLIEPTLTTIKPQVADIYMQLKALRSIQEGLKSQQEESNAQGLCETQLSDIRGTLDRLGETNQDIRMKLPQIQANIEELSTGAIRKPMFEEHLENIHNEINEIRSTNEKTTSSLQDNLQARYDSIESSMSAKIRVETELVKNTTNVDIETLKVEQQNSIDKLLDKVKEARDSIDGRLIVVEKKLMELMELMERRKEDSVASPANSLSRQTSDVAVNKVVEAAALPSSSSSSSAGPITGSKSTTQPMIIISTDRPSTSSGDVDHIAKSTNKVKTNSPQGSPLVKHFRSQSADDDMSDTIDATPKTRARQTRRHKGIPLIEIGDSDQETAIPENDGNNSSDPLLADHGMQVDISKWPKPSTSSARNVTPMTKRKRELSKSLSRSTPPSNSNTPSSSQSSSMKRKKPRF